jgi:hypothetical protein
MPGWSSASHPRRVQNGVICGFGALLTRRIDQYARGFQVYLAVLAGRLSGVALVISYAEAGGRRVLIFGSRSP